MPVVGSSSLAPPAAGSAPRAFVTVASWAAAWLVLGGLASAPAFADGEVTLRGNYWRDRNTRVIAPEASVRKETDDGTTFEAGYLLDAITSASVGAGVMTDQPFTELRNQVGFGVGHRFGDVTISGLYRYSTESDYWAHTGGLSIGVDALQKNLNLNAAFVVGHADVGMRRGALGVLDMGTLDSYFLILSASQVVSRNTIADLSYEMSVLDGLQSNVYRPAIVSGTPVPESLPFYRVRHSLSGGLRFTPFSRRGALRYQTFYFKYRVYADDWGVVSQAPEIRSYTALGPVELRLTARYYTQSAADFYPADVPGQPVAAPMYDKAAQFTYARIGDYPRANGLASMFSPGLHSTVCACYTSDAKLSAFSSVFIEARLQFELRFLDRASVPLGHWLGASTLAVSGGAYINDRFANLQYGNAGVGGIELTLPL